MVDMRKLNSEYYKLEETIILDETNAVVKLLKASYYNDDCKCFK